MSNPPANRNFSQDEERIEKSWERCVIIRKNTVVKRELSDSEIPPSLNGKPIFPFWPRERLRNEAATLQFVASNTTIPVPKGWLYMKDRLLHLKMTRIINGILLADVETSSIPTAIAGVEEQMKTIIMPQLHSLRRSYIGSVNTSLPVIPPQRVYGLDRRYWPQKKSESDEFVLCHNDLSPYNIFVDPDDNFRIVAIIDWEFAGFFPPFFELPLWREFTWNRGRKMYEDVRPRSLAFFGLKEEDLQNDAFTPHTNKDTTEQKHMMEQGDKNFCNPTN